MDWRQGNLVRMFLAEGNTVYMHFTCVEKREKMKKSIEKRVREVEGRRRGRELRLGGTSLSLNPLRCFVEEEKEAKRDGKRLTNSLSLSVPLPPSLTLV